MQFEYTKKECDFGIIHIPTLPISLNGFPIGHALIDTGAEMTLLPMEVNSILNVELDTDNAIPVGSAGGGKFTAIPSKKKIEYTLEHSGFRPIIWKGIVYFAPRQEVILLGQYQCLGELKITLDAPKRKIYVDK